MDMRRIVLSLALLLTASVTAAAQECLSYEPAEVELTGRITRVTFPGPPNYESVRRGDQPEVSWVLVLARPVCVTGNTDDINVAERRVTDLQLILTPEEYKQFRRFVGRRARVRGTLTHAHTGHHHTPVLLDVSSIGSVN